MLVIPLGRAAERPNDEKLERGVVSRESLAVFLLLFLLAATHRGRRRLCYTTLSGNVRIVMGNMSMNPPKCPFRSGQSGIAHLSSNLTPKMVSLLVVPFADMCPRWGISRLGRWAISDSALKEAEMSTPSSEEYSSGRNDAHQAPRYIYFICGFNQSIGSSLTSYHFVEPKWLPAGRTDRQTYRQTDRQTDRQTYRQPYTTPNMIQP